MRREGGKRIRETCVLCTAFPFIFLNLNPYCTKNIFDGKFSIYLGMFFIICLFSLLFEYMPGMCQYDIEASVMTDNTIIHNKLRMIGFEEVMSFVFMEKGYNRIQKRRPYR